MNGGQEVYGKSVFSAQFGGETKTAQKNKVYFEINKTWGKKDFLQ